MRRMAFNHDGTGPGMGLLAPCLLESGKRWPCSPKRRRSLALLVIPDDTPWMSLESDGNPKGSCSGKSADRADVRFRPEPAIGERSIRSGPGSLLNHVPASPHFIVRRFGRSALGNGVEPGSAAPPQRPRPQLIQLPPVELVAPMLPSLSEDSVRYSESRDMHCRRQGKRSAQVTYFFNRGSPEEPFELTTELRGAFIADAS